MEYITMNDVLKLSCPDGFHVLDKEEMAKLRFNEEGSGVCLSDPERHMIVSAAYKQIGGFSSFLLNDKDLLKNLETAMRKAQKPFGYNAAGDVTRSVGGRIAKGIAYTYTAQEIPMYSESLLIREGKTVYYFHVYSREALKEGNMSVWDELLNTSVWSEQ